MAPNAPSPQHDAAAVPALPEAQHESIAAEQRRAHLGAIATTATEKIAARIKATQAGTVADQATALIPSSGLPSSGGTLPLGQPPAHPAHPVGQISPTAAALPPPSAAYEEFMRAMQSLSAGPVPAGATATTAGAVSGAALPRGASPPGQLVIPEEREEGELCPLDMAPLIVAPSAAAAAGPSGGSGDLPRGRERERSPVKDESQLRGGSPRSPSRSRGRASRQRSRSQSRSRSRSRSRDYRRIRQSRSRSRSPRRRSRSRSRSLRRKRAESSRSRSLSPRRQPHSPTVVKPPPSDNIRKDTVNDPKLAVKKTAASIPEATKPTPAAPAPVPAADVPLTRKGGKAVSSINIRPPRTLSLRELTLPAPMEESFLRCLRKIAARKPGIPIASPLVQDEMGPEAGADALQEWGGTFSQLCLLMQKKGLVKLQIENGMWMVDEVVSQQQQQKEGKIEGKEKQKQQKEGKIGVSPPLPVTGKEKEKEKAAVAVGGSATQTAARAPSAGPLGKKNQSIAGEKKGDSNVAAPATITAQPTRLERKLAATATVVQNQQQQGGYVQPPLNLPEGSPTKPSQQQHLPNPPQNYDYQETPSGKKLPAVSAGTFTVAKPTVETQTATPISAALLHVHPPTRSPLAATPLMPMPTDPTRAAVEGYIPLYDVVENKAILPPSLQGMAGRGITARANRHFSSLLLAPGGVSRVRVDISRALGLNFNLGGW